MKHKHDSRLERQPSQIISIYNGDNCLGNAGGVEYADREGFNNGKYTERATRQAYEREGSD